MNKYVFTPLFFLLLLNYASFAQTTTTYVGCLLNSDLANYNSAVNVPFYYGGGPTTYTAPTVLVNIGLYNRTGTCRYYTSASYQRPGCNVAGSPGSVWSFTIYDNCAPANLPVDSYVFYLVLATALLAVYRIKGYNC